MNIFYKCTCMPAEVTLAVPDRIPDSHLMDWMDCVTHCIFMDHRARSPVCRKTQMEYVKIPANETGVGVPYTKQ